MSVKKLVKKVAPTKVNEVVCYIYDMYISFMKLCDDFKSFCFTNFLVHIFWYQKNKYDFHEPNI